MSSRLQQIFMPAAILGCGLVVFYSAAALPGYFSSASYLAELIFLQLLAAALWNYRPRFLPLLVVAFLWAGMALPWQQAWTSGRWFVLGVGALTGFAIYMHDGHYSFSGFHLVASFCVLAAMVSAIVSSYGSVALLKAVSLFLLLLFGASGARIAVVGREARFLAGLLLGCELLVYFTAGAYFVFRSEVFDNPNSLGAVMGVVVTPVLLWGTMVSEQPVVRQRRTFALVLALVLVLSSYARAGIAAAAISSLLLCTGLRRYRLLVQGLGVALLAGMLVITIQPIHHEDFDPDQDSNSLASVFLYKGHRQAGVLASRQSAWDRTSDVIREHPWFGSGFGTSVTRAVVMDQGWVMESAGSATREHGNSYLAITEWVGLLGVGPFFVLIVLIILNVHRVWRWMRRTGNPLSLAVPLAAVLAGGLVHAAFEDWLFAVGYYLCVFFWTLAFVLVDVLPADAPGPVRSAPRPSRPWTESVRVLASSQ